MSTYAAFPMYPAIAGMTSNLIYTPDAANGGSVRVTLSGTAFSVRAQISNAQVTTGLAHLFVPPDASFETIATVTQPDQPIDLPGPVRWVRLIVDSGSVTGGNIEEDATRQGQSAAANSSSLTVYGTTTGGVLVGWRTGDPAVTPSTTTIRGVTVPVIGVTY